MSKQPQEQEDRLVSISVADRDARIPLSKKRQIEAIYAAFRQSKDVALKQRVADIINTQTSQESWHPNFVHGLVAGSVVKKTKLTKSATKKASLALPKIKQFEDQEVQTDPLPEIKPMQIEAPPAAEDVDIDFLDFDQGPDFAEFDDEPAEHSKETESKKARSISPGKKTIKEKLAVKKTIKEKLAVKKPKEEEIEFEGPSLSELDARVEAALKMGPKRKRQRTKAQDDAIRRISGLGRPLPKKNREKK